MIVWINGALGAGKTTLARVLEKELAESVIFDPEHIGFSLRKLVAPAESGDFQDLAIWRRMTTHWVRELSRHRTGPVIVPMALIKTSYQGDILRELERSETLLHVFLAPEEHILRARIARQRLALGPRSDRRIREFRTSRVAEAMAAARELPKGTLVLDPGRDSPGELAHKVTACVANIWQRSDGP